MQTKTEAALQGYGDAIPTILAEAAHFAATRNKTDLLAMIEGDYILDRYRHAVPTSKESDALCEYIWGLIIARDGAS